MSRVQARIVYELEATASRLASAAPPVGIDVLSVTSHEWPGALADLGGVELLLLEQRTSLDVVRPRVYSLAGANPDLLIAVVVPAPRSAANRVLLGEGAFDVIDDGPSLETDLEYTSAAARRVVALQEDRARLNSELAHQDKLSAMGVLAAGVSHEINNPCSAILSNMNVLREQLERVVTGPRSHRIEALDVVGSDWIDAMGDCISAANRIHSIVKTLNVFSRKGDDLPPVATDVNEEIRTVMRLIGKEIRFQAQFEVKLNPMLPLVMAPPNSITQIVTNLVVNALQALDGAGARPPEVSITTDFDDTHVMLEVSDNGPGIQPDVVHRIFDPFFTTKPIGKGTGLGLSITKQLVDKLGGDIFAESEPGNGARFSVVVERSRAAGELAPAELRLPPASERLRVLLLDDDELILRSLQRSLSAHFECQVAARARTALQLLQSDGDYDAVVSDVVMPEMNGFEFWTELGSIHPDLALKTVFISGGITSERLRVRVSDTGRPCLTKPVDMAELVRTIRRVGRPFEEMHR